MFSIWDIISNGILKSVIIFAVDKGNFEASPRAYRWHLLKYNSIDRQVR